MSKLEFFNFLKISENEIDYNRFCKKIEIIKKESEFLCNCEEAHNNDYNFIYYYLYSTIEKYFYENFERSYLEIEYNSKELIFEFINSLMGAFFLNDINDINIFLNQEILKYIFIELSYCNCNLETKEKIKLFYNN